MWKKLVVLAVVFVSPTLAHAMPQTQDDWYVNSGRYINGQVPSYDQGRAYYQGREYYQDRSQKVYLTARETRRRDRMIESRASGFVPQGYFATGREQMVMALGN
jgi:hypothetical protein